MGSKFIKNSSISNKVKSFTAVTSNEDMWYSMGSPKEDREEVKQNEEYRQSLLAKKLSIESKHLEEVSFKDMYAFPFHQAKYGSRVYDADSNFIFQFEFNNDKTREGIINILNGEIEPTKENIVKHKEGIIYVEKEGEDKALIMIRGWGNLTGCGAYNLDGEYAGRIQDTLAEYIVEKLTILK